MENEKQNKPVTNHTPTPCGGPYMAGDMPQGKLWVEENTGTIRDDRNRWILSLAQWTDGTLLVDAKAYAAFVVRAVNSHELLLDALKTAKKRMGAFGLTTAHVDEAIAQAERE